MSRAKYMAEYRERKNNGSFQDQRVKNKDLIDNCLNCGTELGPRVRANRPKKFCNNNKCQHEYNRKRAIDLGIAGIGSTKRFLSETRGYKCEECGISEWNGKPIILDLDHINGNSNDNGLENVRLLCPNCHSQTDTYKVKNRGNGRKKVGIEPKPFYPKLSNLDHQ
jgi:predicted RNA-binding Zn-ribbon protein involved in translation (DUF1610 family)